MVQIIFDWSRLCWRFLRGILWAAGFSALALQTHAFAQSPSNLTLSAALSTSATPIQAGLYWRIYKGRLDASGSVDLVAESGNATPSFNLEPGNYIVHVGLGLAGGTKSIQISGQPLTEKIILNAGAMTISPVLGGTKLTDNKVSMSIFVPERTNSEAKLVIADAKPDQLIVLPPGRYHIKSVYLDTVGVGALDATAGTASPTNSVVTADLAVQTGKITDVTLRHRAAVITLKLVNKLGGEALANTSFTVLTPGGDVIRELVGAFPSLVLAEGDYVAIASHDNKTFQRDFRVETAYDHDVEIPVK